MTDAQDLPFRHYGLRHRAIAWISRCLFDRFTYTVRHGLIRGMKRTGGLGWLPAWLAGGAETQEEMFWRGLPLDGLVVYDVGAFHGILTLWFAGRGAQVIAYEPNEVNHARLMENIRLNRLAQVRVRKLGVGSLPGCGTLHYSPQMAGGGTVNPDATGPVSQRVEITTLDGDIAAANLPAPDFIKIDVEGWELEALRGARVTLDAHHPALFLEMHGETMREKKRKAAEIVAFLRNAGYANIVHVESGAAITPANDSVAAEGHLYCRYTAGRSGPCPTNISSQPLTASLQS
ncbi:MAG TPA: FkbM family methyltransferase [Bryobacteraceae bacterium]|nr:FkbM family methyltransferase [Bryobacteraceae bacterium]